MSTPLEKPQAPPPPQPPAAGNLGSRESQIRVIPESYYGVALKLEPPFATDEEEGKPVAAAPASAPVPEAPKPVSPAPAAPVPAPVEHHSRLWLIGLVVFVLLAGAGGWVAWNRQALFGGAPAPVAPIAETPIAPNAPSDLTVTSPTAGVARLVWQDHSQTESGYRVERKGPSDQSFSIIQNLPANSLTFLDPTAPTGVTSTYRITAFNPGGDSTPEVEARVFVLAPPPPAPPAPTLPPDGLDLDSDGLTNTEEAVYGSNNQLPDTDGDGYLDGNEVFNLYAPTVAAPATLLSLPSMQVVTSTVGWQTLLPQAWMVERTQESADVRVRPGTGEVFVFRVEANASRQSIRAWLLAQKGIQGAQVTELMSNKYKVPFFLGPDRLNAYIPWGDQVLTVSYQLGTQSFVNYRTSFGLILNALRLTESPTLPDLTGPNTIPPAFQMTTTSTTSAVSSASSSMVAVPMSSSTVPRP
jgi:hypothetical protein